MNDERPAPAPVANADPPRSPEGPREPVTRPQRAARSAEWTARTSPDDLDDPSLWVGLTRADQSCFTELFTRHNKVVYNFAFRSTASWSAAEDITQTTFLNLWKRAKQGRIDPLTLPTAVPLLLSMTRHECLNNVRTQQRQLRLVGRVGDHLDAGSNDTHNNNVSEWMERESTMTQIRQALSVLSDDQIAVVELVAWAGLAMGECAEVLGVPEGTVKSRLNRARQLLRDSPIAHLVGGEHR